MYRYVSYSKLSKSLVGENWPGFTMPHFRKERNYTSRQSSCRNSVVYHGFLHCIHSTFGGIESECWVASCRARDSLWISKVRYLTHMMMKSWFAVLASLCVGMMMTWLDLKTNGNFDHDDGAARQLLVDGGNCDYKGESGWQSTLLRNSN